MGRLALLCAVRIVPNIIHKPVVIKLLVFGLEIYIMYIYFTSLHVLYLYRFSFVLVICHININLTEAGVMHEAGYVYYIWTTYIVLLPFWIITSCPFVVIWKVLLAIVSWF